MVRWPGAAPGSSRSQRDALLLSYAPERMCRENKLMLRDGETMLGQGDRGGGGPTAGVAEGNTGPVWFPRHPKGASRALVYFPAISEMELPAGAAPATSALQGRRSAVELRKRKMVTQLRSLDAGRFLLSPPSLSA